MLTRAARQRQTLQLSRNASHQLQLPWLCPALYTSFTSASSHPPRRPIIPRSHSDPSITRARLSTQSRKLASPSPSSIPNLLQQNDGYFPPYTPNPSKPSHLSHSRAPPFSPHLYMMDPLKLEHSTEVALPKVNTKVKKEFEATGNVLDIEVTMDACLQIQKWDRAYALLKQLVSMYNEPSETIQRIYDRFLESMVFDIVWNRSTENQARIDNWVEGEMLRAGVQPTARTFALKIKAALSGLDGRKRDRVVSRYWDMATRYEVDSEVASLRDILSDRDLGKLSEICPLQLDVQEQPDLDDSDTMEVTMPETFAQPSLPTILETEQKGLGMHALRESLLLFTDAQEKDEWNSIRGTERHAAMARKRQERLEQDSLEIALKRWKDENDKMMKMGVSSAMSSGSFGALVWQWHGKMKLALEKELELIAAAEANQEKKSAEDRRRLEYGPFLRLLTPEKLAALTIISTMQVVVRAGVDQANRVINIVSVVGKAVEHEIELENHKRVQDLKSSQKRTDMASKRKEVEQAPPAESTFRKSGSRPLQVPASAPTAWTPTIRTRVGAVLAELFFDNAKIDVPGDLGAIQGSDTAAPTTEQTITRSAFDRQIIYKAGRAYAIAVTHEKLIEMLTKEPIADMIAKSLPMIVQPNSWTGFNQGPFLKTRVDVLRNKSYDTSQREYTKAAARRGDLDQIYKGLNVLGATAWRINEDVFRVIVEAWNSGEAIAKIPPLNLDPLTLPPLPENPTLQERFAHQHKVLQLKHERGGQHSNRCFQNFQLEIARAYIGEVFYLPHNLDFRGRAYPIPPYLNQMGADNARGLLLFAEGRPLGAAGLKWLKVHLANVFGFDKASLSERAQFATDHMDDIRDSVENPLGGRRWWLTAEDPWQCLATCFELTKAYNSGDPESFVSHMPVHQDGTCNGLQHYAALGGDIAGAKQVNLEPSDTDKPADVYTGVAELVRASVHQDAVDGHPIAQILDGRIARKIVKQTVMTNVYGVTFHGARAQVKKQLDVYIPELKEQGLEFQAADMVAKKIFKGLGTLFAGARELQSWFGDSAQRIVNSISSAQVEQMIRLLEPSQDNKIVGKEARRKQKAKADKEAIRCLTPSNYRSAVVWTTPLNLPVVQPYRKSECRKVSTNSTSTFVVREPSIADAVDRQKQIRGFPPNFIHSLDATHMMLSALDAHKEGLIFSAVHDSFWTHACDVDKLNYVLREAFIRMHGEDVIGRLAAEFNTRYSGHLRIAKVQGRTKLGAAILAYRRKLERELSKTDILDAKTASRRQTQLMQHELILEYRRQRLLASKQAADRKQGRAMVTAASIFEDHDGEQHLTTETAALGEAALGVIPESAQQPDAGDIAEALQHENRPEDQNVDLSSSLDPLLNLSEDDVGDVVSGPEAPALGTTGRGKKKQEHTTWVWLPLRFKPVPQKGGWDLTRIRESKYFFS